MKYIYIIPKGLTFWNNVEDDSKEFLYSPHFIDEETEVQRG